MFRFEKGPFMSDNLISCWQAREQILLLVSKEEIWLRTAVFALRTSVLFYRTDFTLIFFQKVLTVFDKIYIKSSQSSFLLLDFLKVQIPLYIVVLFWDEIGQLC